MSGSDVDVSYNKETFAQFMQPVLAKFPSLASELLDDFKRYKSGELPSYFGKDSIYTAPYTVLEAQLWHIHLKIPPNEFPESQPQVQRTCSRGDPENDIALVYVQGEFELNRYSIIGALHPDAHEIAKKTALMNYLASVAKRFREVN